MPIVSLSPGTRGLPSQLTIESRPADRGIEGAIYFTTDGAYAVKIYDNPPPDKRQLLQRVLELGQDLGAAGRFLVWPRGIVRALDGTPVVGVAMDRVPSPPFDELERLILSPVSALAQFRQGRTWSAYLKMARATAAAVRTMHGLGMGHGDLKLQNVKADAVSGEIRLLDLDSPVVRGYLAPEVQGSPRFIAPEILMHSGEAGILADRHSLAVLILWTLLFRDVMEPRRCY